MRLSLLAKEMMVSRKYRVIIERDPEDDVYIASVPALPGCNTFGKTAKEAIDMAREATEAYIETLRDLGKEVPMEDGARDEFVDVRN